MKFIPLIIVCLLVVRCNKEDAHDCFQSSGEKVSQIIDLSETVTEIEVYDNIKLKLRNNDDNDQLIILSGGENLLNDISFTLNGGVLEIRNDNGCNWVREDETFEVDISSNAIAKVTNYSLEGIVCNEYSADTFRFDQWDSLADNVLDMNTSELSVNLHTGAGSVLVSGLSEHANFYISGVNRINSYEFTSQTANINNSGLGDIYISVTDYLFAQINGSGDIFYNTEDIIIESSINGTGELSYLDF